MIHFAFMPKHMVKLESNYVRTHLLKIRYHNEAVLFIVFWVCDACVVDQGRCTYSMHMYVKSFLFWKLIIFSTTKRLDIKRYHDPRKFFAYLISFVCFVCVQHESWSFRIMLLCTCSFHCVNRTSNMGEKEK